MSSSNVLLTAIFLFAATEDRETPHLRWSDVEPLQGSEVPGEVTRLFELSSEDAEALADLANALAPGQATVVAVRGHLILRAPEAVVTYLTRIAEKALGPPSSARPAERGESEQNPAEPSGAASRETERGAAPLSDEQALALLEEGQMLAASLTAAGLSDLGSRLKLASGEGACALEIAYTGGPVDLRLAAQALALTAKEAPHLVQVSIVVKLMKPGGRLFGGAPDVSKDRPFSIEIGGRLVAAGGTVAGALSQGKLLLDRLSAEKNAVLHSLKLSENRGGWSAEIEASMGRDDGSPPDLRQLVSSLAAASLSKIDSLSIERYENGSRITLRLRSP
jgi:hypothetical protein